MIKTHSRYPSTWWTLFFLLAVGYHWPRVLYAMISMPLFGLFALHVVKTGKPIQDWLVEGAYILLDCIVYAIAILSVFK